MIDALFGSKTRVKLLGLFMNNPGRSFYVREITRNIDEQINSVRRELANLVRIGIVTDKSVDNRLYYQVDPNFRYYHALREMFADDDEVVSGAKVSINDWATKFRSVAGVDVVVLAGTMVYGSDSKIDLLIVGVDNDRMKSLREEAVGDKDVAIRRVPCDVLCVKNEERAELCFDTEE